MRIAWWIYAGVFCGKLVEVALSALRTQLVVKGQKKAGASIAAIEYIFWFFITATAMTRYGSDPLMIVLLALAFALGQIVGSALEEKLALGVSIIHVFFMQKADAEKTAEILRKNGFGLTILTGHGIGEAERPVMILAIQRRHIPRVRALVHDVAPKAVVTLTSAVSIEGGTLPVASHAKLH